MSLNGTGGRLVVAFRDNRYSLYDFLSVSNEEQRYAYVITDDPEALVKCALFVANEHYRSRMLLKSIRASRLDTRESGVMVDGRRGAMSHTRFIRDGKEYFADFSVSEGLCAFRHFALAPVQELIWALASPDGGPFFTEPPRIQRSERDIAMVEQLVESPPDPSGILGLGRRANVKDLLRHLTTLLAVKGTKPAIELNDARHEPEGGPRSDIQRLRSLADGQVIREGDSPVFGDFWFVPKANREQLPARLRDTVASWDPSDRMAWEIVGVADGNDLLITPLDDVVNELHMSSSLSAQRRTLWAPGIGDALERSIRLLHADCSYWELGAAGDGREDSLRPMLPHIAKYTRLGHQYAEPNDDGGAADAFSAVVPFLQLIGADISGEAANRRVTARAAEWRVHHENGTGQDEIRISSGENTSTFVNGSDAARYLLYAVLESMRTSAYQEGAGNGPQLEVPQPFPHEIRRVGGQGTAFRAYGQQPLREIVGYFGLPIVRTGQMYGVYTPGA